MNAIPDTTVRTAETLALAPLLTCLLRELAEPAGPAEPCHPERAAEAADGHGRRVYRLRPSGSLLRVRGPHRPGEPALWNGRDWTPLDHAGVVALAEGEMRKATGRDNGTLGAEMADSREVVAAILAARDPARAPEDLWIRSEQSLIGGHPCHPAPKARGGGPAAGWLPYAPEAYARFPLALLGVREDALVDEGDTAALDALGEAPPGYRLLPAHPWQLELVRELPELRAAFADGRLVRLGTTDRTAWPTASLRTVYLPGGPSGDLSLKFSLDVRITNDIRRLWRHDLLRVLELDREVADAFAALASPAAWMRDRGYRTVDGLLFEPCAVLLRDGLEQHLPPGTEAVLPAAVAEGFDGNPLDRAADPGAWWAAYLRAVVPPVLEVFERHGLVLECHLQNTLVAVDRLGTPVRAVFRDPEGVKRVSEVGRAAGWERLVYCLLVNHLAEVAGAVAERFPAVAYGLWPAVRAELERYAARRPLPEIAALLASPTLPGKANLLLRWTDADGADSRYLPLRNPLPDPGAPTWLDHAAAAAPDGPPSRPGTPPTSRRPH
ncbi:IucA/IucC family protein [Streptomyces sp. NPDC101132]|uniref:IucA/IucC family protein n=1 Tax=Streptomyces sp. NPDC101132 TaxID=3366110 RepID=UPI00380600A5